MTAHTKPVEIDEVVDGLEAGWGIEATPIGRGRFTYRRIPPPGTTPGCIHFVEAEGMDRVKIGWTSGDPQKRLRQLQIGSPVKLRLMGTAQGTIRDERELHRRLAASRVEGLSEWFHHDEAVRSEFRRRWPR